MERERERLKGRESRWDPVRLGRESGTCRGIQPVEGQNTTPFDWENPQRCEHRRNRTNLCRHPQNPFDDPLLPRDHTPPPSSSLLSGHLTPCASTRENALQSPLLKLGPLISTESGSAVRSWAKAAVRSCR